MDGPKDYQSYEYIQDRVKAFYSSGGKRRSKEEAIDHIRYCRNRYWAQPGLGWTGRSRRYRIILRFMTYELSRVIRESPLSDPIEILYTYANWVEDIFVESEAIGNSDMTRDILEAVREILEHLG